MREGKKGRLKKRKVKGKELKGRLQTTIISFFSDKNNLFVKQN